MELFDICRHKRGGGGGVMNSVQAVRTIRSRKTAVNYSKSGDVSTGIRHKEEKTFL